LKGEGGELRGTRSTTSELRFTSHARWANTANIPTARTSPTEPRCGIAAASGGERGTTKHDPEATACRGYAARDQETREPAAAERADVSREVDDPRDRECLLVQAAAREEVFREPELKEIPDGIGEHAGEDEQPHFTPTEDAPPWAPVGGGGGFLRWLVTGDERPFGVGEARVFGRAAVKPEPRDEPKQAGGASDDKGGLPTMPRGETNDQDRRERGTNGGAKCVDADGEAALFGGKPFGDRLGRGGPVARFAKTEEKTKRPK